MIDVIEKKEDEVDLNKYVWVFDVVGLVLLVCLGVAITIYLIGG